MCTRYAWLDIDKCDSQVKGCMNTECQGFLSKNFMFLYHLKTVTVLYTVGIFYSNWSNKTWLEISERDILWPTFLWAICCRDFRWLIRLMTLKVFHAFVSSAKIAETAILLSFTECVKNFHIADISTLSTTISVSVHLQANMIHHVMIISYKPNIWLIQKSFSHLLINDIKL